jgi:hypothetical protein
MRDRWNHYAHRVRADFSRAFYHCFCGAENDHAVGEEIDRKPGGSR